MNVHTDHSALKHLFKKQDAKPRLIRWILLLQEFNIEIKHRKGTKNVAADHLSRIKNDEISDENEVDDNFPRETLMEINTRDEPYKEGYANVRRKPLKKFPKLEILLSYNITSKGVISLWKARTALTLGTLRSLHILERLPVAYKLELPEELRKCPIILSTSLSKEMLSITNPSHSNERCLADDKTQSLWKNQWMLM
ncbi:reverse transcriptase domain-containing protein [Tanacetum coccineum]